MLKRFEQHIYHHFNFLKEKKLLIAISGGVDSVVLTHLLHQLKFDISLAHCNFELRGKESDTDEFFVKDLGKGLQLNTYTTTFKTEEYATKHKTSIQIAARELRYQWFEELISKHQLDYVLTAHHLDDNLETFLINLTRGTGLDGLTGIPPINNNIARPLLMFSREEIEQFAANNRIKWREDASNASNKYVRNKLRNQVIPILKEINPSLLTSFLKTTENLKGNQQIIKDAVSKFKKDTLLSEENGIVKIDVSKISKVINPKAYLFELLNSFGFKEWNDIENLLIAQSGKQVFSKTHRLLKNRDYLLLSKITHQNKFSEITITEKTKELLEPIHISFEAISEPQATNVDLILIDSDKITFPLKLRKWQDGDYFYPIGMQGKKKLSKLFKDLKYSLIEKENAWVLCSNNEIIWVIGERQDRRFTIDKKTKNILKTHITH